MCKTGCIHVRRVLGTDTCLECRRGTGRCEDNPYCDSSGPSMDPATFLGVPFTSGVPGRGLRSTIALRSIRANLLNRQPRLRWRLSGGSEQIDTEGVDSSSCHASEERR
jgi:hypothetical protein